MRFFFIAIPIILFSNPASSQNLEIIKFEQLNQLIQERNKEIRIFNFWATWCKPCIQELPQFESISKLYPEGEVKVYLISLDFIDQLETKLKPFIKKKQLQSQVKLLDETDFNSFIDKIDPRWSGAIPATLIITPGGTKEFYEKEFMEGELEKVVANLMN